jgi:hypothetical protein
MKDTRIDMYTNRHTLHVGKRYWSYCCRIHPSALDIRIEDEREDLLLYVKKEYLLLRYLLLSQTYAAETYLFPSSISS